MRVEESVTWPTCDQVECTGIRLEAGHGCLAHADDQQRDAVLKHISETGEIDARGVTISSALLEKIVGSAPRGPSGVDGVDGPIFKREVRFDGATFEGWATFALATFESQARFDGATFKDEARFDGVTFDWAVFDGVTFESEARFDVATFKSEASFDGATFEGSAGFDRATFEERALFSTGVRTQFSKAVVFAGEAEFSEVTFKDAAEFGGAIFEGGALFSKGVALSSKTVVFAGGAGFDGATFKSWAGFDGATFQSDARFDGATFESDARFDGATFKGWTRFDGATFKDEARFDGATFKGWNRFDGATFKRAQQFGPVLAHRGLNLDGAQFVQPVQIEASTAGMCCRRTRFPGGVQFRLRWARVVLDDTDFSAPSLLTGIPRLASDETTAQEERIARGWQRLLAGQISEQPRLLSLQRANLAGLGLANVSLADCRFNGAHNLDKLRLEADVAFELSPARVGWEQRQVVAEECTWRAGRARPGAWADPWWPDRTAGWPEDLKKPSVLAPGSIAGLYRALRKSREDAKDEPGAADFYYGEMEMRRHAHGRAGPREGGSRGRVDRGVLTAYWLVSGYGLRAWRALAWLAGITVGFALAFHLVGFTSPPQPATYWTSLLYAFRSTISLTDDAVTLTAWGQLLQALLRLTGPVLVGLALLALRGRIKR